MGADEGIEDEKSRSESIHGLTESLSLFFEIDAQGRFGDDVDLETLERDVASPGDPLDPLADDVESIFTGEEENRAVLFGGIATQTLAAGCHGNGQIEGEERLEALGLAPDHPDGLIGP